MPGLVPARLSSPSQAMSSGIELGKPGARLRCDQGRPCASRMTRAATAAPCLRTTCVSGKAREEGEINRERRELGRRGRAPASERRAGQSDLEDIRKPGVVLARDAVARSGFRHRLAARRPRRANAHHALAPLRDRPVRRARIAAKARRASSRSRLPARRATAARKSGSPFSAAAASGAHKRMMPRLMFCPVASTLA